MATYPLAPSGTSSKGGPAINTPNTAPAMATYPLAPSGTSSEGSPPINTPNTAPAMATYPLAPSGTSSKGSPPSTHRTLLLVWLYPLKCKEYQKKVRLDPLKFFKV
ncbi:hypothetical protein DPMN_072609 [Dreissena polymorpha]|uniref:Uncharacterized protein n=1 Tax=Dreissena polymorpha TaxID=45954 RepID=A0A9D4BXL1_DREPO|nr:hypothetical protein DPMN_072609 [Dreissena polymorpha]